MGRYDKPMYQCWRECWATYQVLCSAGQRKPTSAILSVLLDFTDLEGPEATNHGVIYPDFVYVDYQQGITFDAQGDLIELSLSYSDDDGFLKLL